MDLKEYSFVSNLSNTEVKKKIKVRSVQVRVFLMWGFRNETRH